MFILEFANVYTYLDWNYSKWSTQESSQVVESGINFLCPKRNINEVSNFSHLIIIALN